MHLVEALFRGLAPRVCRLAGEAGHVQGYLACAAHEQQPVMSRGPRMHVKPQERVHERRW